MRAFSGGDSNHLGYEVYCYLYIKWSMILTAEDIDNTMSKCSYATPEHSDIRKPRPESGTRSGYRNRCTIRVGSVPKLSPIPPLTLFTWIALVLIISHSILEVGVELILITQF